MNGGNNIFRQNSTEMAFETNNTERMRLNATGLGIGTTSPATNLHLVASSPQIRLQHSGNSFFSRIITDSGNNLILGTGSNGVERMRIDSSGRVGIGTTSPSHKLDIVGGGLEITQEETTDAIALLDSTQSNQKYLAIFNDTLYFSLPAQDISQRMFLINYLP